MKHREIPVDVLRYPLDPVTKVCTIFYANTSSYVIDMVFTKILRRRTT